MISSKAMHLFIISKPAGENGTKEHHLTLSKQIDNHSRRKNEQETRLHIYCFAVGRHYWTFSLYYVASSAS